ncbi:MAG: hypothetical protein V5A57_03705 [Candidatus Paceibacterota bacterium]
MKDTAVFCEGKNDIKFFENILEKYDNTIHYATFKGEEVKYERLNNKETEYVRNFLRYDRQKFLIKSEGGKPNLKTAFAHFAAYLSQTNTRMVVMTDTDTNQEHKDSLHKFTDDIKEKFNSGHRESTGHTLQTLENINRKNSYLLSKQSYILNREGEKESDFITVAWRESLESVAGVKEDYSDAEEKIENLAQNSAISDFFKQIIF